MSRYYQLSKIGRVARRTSILSMIFTISELAVFISIVGSKVAPLDLLVLASVQLLPGIIILALADVVGGGNPPAFFTIFAIAVLAPVRSLLAMFFSHHGSLGPLGFFCDIYTSIPLVWLAWTCNESMDDVRQLIRRRREDRLGAQRGFEPIMPGQGPSVIRPPAVQPAREPAPQPIAEIGEPGILPKRSKRFAISHSMHLAAHNARVVAMVSSAGALVLIGLNLAIEHNRGDPLLNASLQYVLLYYLVPALLLIVLAWRMERQDVWSYVFCMLLSFALLTRWAISLMMARAFRLEVANFTYLVDSLSRWTFIFLAVRTYSALPDAWDNRRQRRREDAIERKRARGELQAVSPLAAVTPPPAAGTRRSSHPGASR